MWGGVGCCARENSEDAAGVGLGGVGVDLAVALQLHQLGESSSGRASVQE